MRRIVVGVDESCEAAEAVRWAYDESRRRGLRLMAVLAWDPIEAVEVARDGYSAPVGLTSRVAELVFHAIPGHADEVECEVVCDQPARALLESSTGAELLVVGVRGSGTPHGDAGIGSVSQQCAMHSSVPVAVVRTTGRTSAPAEKRIVVGIDGSPTSLRALDWALDEARFRGAGLTVVCAWRPVHLADGAQRSGAADATALVRHALANARTDGLSHRIDTVVADRDAADAILAAGQDATLIVVGTRGRGGFPGLRIGSVSQHVLIRAICPLVLVPPYPQDVSSQPAWLAGV